MRILIPSIFTIALMASIGYCQNPFNPSRNQSQANSSNNTTTPPASLTVGEALNRVLNNVIAGAHTALKNLLTKNLQIDPFVLRSGFVSAPVSSSGRDLVELALEKIVDKLNFQFYKARANATYDPIREHTDYFRLQLNDKLAVLMENVYNSTIGAMTSIDENFNKEPKSLEMRGEGKEMLEAKFVQLITELFDGIAKFFDKFRSRNCVQLELYKHKIERLERDIKHVLEKIGHLTLKARHIDSDEASSEEIEEIEARLKKLKEQVVKLTYKLFKIIDEFFKKNSHIKDREFCAARNLYNHIKWSVIRVLKELKESHHRHPHKHHDWKKPDYEESNENSSPESESESSESSEEKEKEKESHELEGHHGIDSRKHFKRVVKHLLKNIADFYRKCVEKKQKQLNEIKKHIFKIKFELIKLLKRVEIESEEDSSEEQHGSGSDESSEERSWKRRNHHLIWRFKKLAKRFIHLKLRLHKLLSGVNSHEDIISHEERSRFDVIDQEMNLAQISMDEIDSNNDDDEILEDNLLAQAKAKTIKASPPSNQAVENNSTTPLIQTSTTTKPNNKTPFLTVIKKYLNNN